MNMKHVLFGFLGAVLLLVGCWYLAGWANPPERYYKQVAIAVTALKGEKVSVSDLSNIQAMVLNDGTFQKALRNAGLTTEDIQRLTGEELLYVQTKK